jgi:geranylgeranyl pyrophosphate synthase
MMEEIHDAEAASSTTVPPAIAPQSNGAQPTPDVRPDVRDTVVAAVEVAAERGMPLVAGTLGPGRRLNAAPRPHVEQDTAPAASALSAPSTPGRWPANGLGDGEELPHIAPWNQLSSEALADLRSVDIMQALHGIEPQMKAVDREIERLITTPVKLIADLASHTLGAGGKRLRPALTILAAQACGDAAGHADPRVVTCAAMVELMHTTALIHDDVVDAAQTRRGKPAANLIWGNETSVLVGDYLSAQVFVTAAQKEFIDLLPVIAMATSQMCAGEILETQTRGHLSMKEKQYQEVIALKTAALTDCACRLGAMAMAAAPDRVERLSRFGRDIGMAFQIVDDVFDVVATESCVGKPVGNDIREGDVTLPMLRAMQVVPDAEKDELRALIGKSPISDDEVARVLEVLRGCDAVEYSLKAARDFVASAKTQLEAFEPGGARAMLQDIADYVLSRDK